MAPHTHVNTVDHKIFVDDLFQQKLNTRNILCNVRRPIAILVAKVWWWKLYYAKNLQAKYFIGENIPIYGNTHLSHNIHFHLEWKCLFFSVTWLTYLSLIQYYVQVEVHTG